MQLVALLSGVLVALLPFVALYRVVAREEKKIAATATPEMWGRTIDDYTQHLNDERASRDGLTRSESRIGHTGPTTKSNASLQV